MAKKNLKTAVPVGRRPAGQLRLFDIRRVIRVDKTLYVSIPAALARIADIHRGDAARCYYEDGNVCYSFPAVLKNPFPEVTP